MRYKENKSYQLLKEMASTMTRTMKKILETDDVDAVGDELLRDVLKMYGAGRVFVIYEQKGKLNITQDTVVFSKLSQGKIEQLLS